MSEEQREGRRRPAWCRDDSALPGRQAADSDTGWTVGISFEPQPEIEFKVLRIRVKCQKGQLGDLFRLA